MVVRPSPRVAMGAGIAALAVVLRLPTITQRLFDTDEAAIGVQGLVVRAGGTLYRDIFDRKPPLPPLAYAASFSLTNSTDVRPLRILVTLCLAAAGVLIATDTARRHGVVAGWWAGALLVAGAMAFLPADAGAANYAHFALLPGTAAVLWLRRRGLGWAVAGGVALGVAILCRQSWLLAVVPAGFSAYRSNRWVGTLVALGGAAGVVLTTGLYAPLGGFWEWNVANSPGFVFAATGYGPAIARGIITSLTFIAFHLVAAVCLWLGVRRLRRDGRDDLDLWVWLLFSLIAVAAGLRFYGHYWLQVLPPLVVLTAPIAARAAGRLRQLAIAGVALPAVVAFALLFVPGSFHGRPDPAALVTYIRAHTTTDQRVFVWGSYPEVFVAADRLPAGALVHTDFVTGRSGGRTNPATTLGEATPGALAIMMSDLRSHPPELVLDTSTAKNLGYKNYPLSTINAVFEFVNSNYHVVTVIDGVTVWQRSP